ncbi:hypothetical protein LDY98_05140, partial [Pseudomonas aeruginosa]|nr:hypothetical protein [Pseudomonas aeruginosa]
GRPVALRRPAGVRPARSAGATLLHTETRVFCPDRASRLRFTPYWVAIRPVSGLIRRRLLAGIGAEHPGFRVQQGSAGASCRAHPSGSSKRNRPSTASSSAAAGASISR